MDVWLDEHYMEPHFAMRSSIDRRFWTCNGGSFEKFISYGVVDDTGEIVRTDKRP